MKSNRFSRITTFWLSNLCLKRIQKCQWVLSSKRCFKLSCSPIELQVIYRSAVFAWNLFTLLIYVKLMRRQRELSLLLLTLSSLDFPAFTFTERLFCWNWKLFKDIKLQANAVERSLNAISKLIKSLIPFVDGFLWKSMKVAFSVRLVQSHANFHG